MRSQQEPEVAAPDLDVGNQSLRVNTLRQLLPDLPRFCARFTDQLVYAKPSHMLKAIVDNLPEDRRWNEDQTLFMLRFGDVLDTVYEEEQNLPPEKRSVYHLLLLGQGGSGKTYVVQNLIFPVVHFLWPPEAERETLMVVAAKNSQAKNISTAEVRARTLHTAACMRIQSLANRDMAAGQKDKALQQRWGTIRVLIIEEISMVSAMLYNMLDYRAMLGRRVIFKVEPQTYTKVGAAFGRIPIVLHLGDFYQLRPTAQLSLIEDLQRQDENGQYVHKDVPLEAQHAHDLFAAIPDVFELRGTKRFKPKDPLIDILQCMRAGQPFPEALWKQFQQRFVTDPKPGVADPRLDTAPFRTGYCMSIYWTSLVRMLYRRVISEATRLGKVMVMLQAADTCLDLDRAGCLRFLNQPNPYRTGSMHGIFPCYAGMQIRLLARLDAEQGLVQDTVATIMDFELHATDRERYLSAAAGDIFVPRYLPSGLWVSVTGYSGCAQFEDMMDLCREHTNTEEEAKQLAKSFWFLPAEEVVVPYNKVEVRRCGFRITHAQFLTSTASQGVTLRDGTIIDCARQPEMDEDNWWLHLYVMLSRVTCLEHLLLMRPPPRELLERGPPATIRASMTDFASKALRCREGIMTRHRL